MLASLIGEAFARAATNDADRYREKLAKHAEGRGRTDADE
jgi:hypothetical protein